MIDIYPRPEALRRLQESPEGGPVVMLNLLRYREAAIAPDEGSTGEEAYARYAGSMRKIVEEAGGRILWMGTVDSMVIGESPVEFHTAALVEYPSRRVFLEVVGDPRVQEIGVHRAAGLEGQWLLAMTPREP